MYRFDGIGALAFLHFNGDPLRVQNCTDAVYDTKIRYVMPEQPTICPKCWDNMLEPVSGVELVAVHSSAMTIVSPALLYRCSQWHIFAVFSCTPPQTPQA
jgi:hypothetical protein